MNKREQLLTRRPVLAGLIAVTGAVAAGIAIDLIQPKHARYHGPDEDLVNTLDDPQSAGVVGATILAHAANRDVALREARSFAKDRLQKEKLIEALSVDAEHGFLTEANGWVLPITLAALCALATQ